MGTPKGYPQFWVATICGKAPVRTASSQARVPSWLPIRVKDPFKGIYQKYLVASLNRGTPPQYTIILTWDSQKGYPSYRGSLGIYRDVAMYRPSGLGGLGFRALGFGLRDVGCGSSFGKSFPTNSRQE